MVEWDFWILGALEVRLCDVPISVPASKHRALLAMLIVEANRVVPAARLIDGLWGADPPGSAAGTLQSYVSQVRRLLEPERPSRAEPSVIVSRSGGYLLRVPELAVDAERFRRRSAEGRSRLRAGDAEPAADALSEALAMWRGPPLLDFEHQDWAQADRRALEELRSTTFEDWIEAELIVGRDPSIVSALQAAVHREPHRERLWRELMLGLYRSGRQADALAAYQEARGILVTELGVEPGPDLRSLHAQVLTQDPALDPVVPPRGVATRAAPPPGHEASETPKRRRILAGVGACLLMIMVAGAVIVATVQRTRGGSNVAVRISESSIALIDPASNRIVGDLALPAPPTGLVTTPRWLWATSERDRTLTRIKPSNLQPAGTTRLSATPTGLSAGRGDGVWVAEGYARRLLNIQAQPSGSLLERVVPFAGCCAGPSIVSESENVVFAADAAGLRRIDADHPTTVAQYTRGTGSAAIAHIPGAVFVSDGWRTIRRISPYTNRVTAKIDVSTSGHPGLPTAMTIADGQVWIVATGLNEVLQLNASGTKIAGHVAVGRDPGAITYGAGDLWVANSADGTISRIDPQARRVVATIRVGHRVGTLTFSHGKLWAALDPAKAGQREGGLIVFDDHSQIFIERADGTHRRQLTHGAGVKNVEPAWSPDGSQIAFASNRGPSRTDYHFDVYVMNADGTGQVRLTTDLHAVSVGPIWSADGSKIAFWRGHVRGGFAVGDVYSMSSDGKHTRRLTFSGDGQSWPHSWSALSQRVLITSTRSNPAGMGAIYAMDASGAHIRPLRVSNVDNVDNPTWAPDGLRVAYSGNDHGPGIYITTTANNGTVRVTPPGGSFGGAQLYGQPGWSPDGTAIAYAGTFEVPGNLYVINSDGTGITQLTDDLESGSPSWRPIQ